MNKPIRTVSIFCLLLFLALALNATYLQYYHAERAQRPRRQRPGGRRDVLPRARRDPGRRATSLAESVRVQRPVQVPARLPQAVHVRPGHRLVHLRQRDRRRARPELLPLRRGRPAVRQPPGRPGQRQRHQGRQRRAHHRPGGAEGGVRRAAGARPRRPGRRRGDRAGHRQDPGDGLAADLRPQQAGRPTTSRRPTPTPRSSEDARRSRCSTAPIQTTLPPGLDLQARDRRGRDRRAATTPRARWCPAARPTSSRSPRNVVHNEIPNCGTDKIPFTQAMEWSCNTSFAPLGRRRRRRRRCTSTAEGFGFNQTYLEDLTRPGRLAVPRRHGRAADRACPASARARSRRPRCRWRWSPPASPTAAW